jgi:hypothetical protein
MVAIAKIEQVEFVAAHPAHAFTQVVYLIQIKVKHKTDVIVTSLSDAQEEKSGKRIPGGLKGKITIPDDFNAPLDDLKEYA